MRSTVITGAQPNFVKVVPVIHAIKAAQATGAGISYRLVHIGQQQPDPKMK